MRRRFVVFWLLAVSLLLAATVGFLSVASGVESRWSSDYGPLTLTVAEDGSVTGLYPEFDGRIVATFHPDLRLIAGYWQQARSDAPCRTDRDGTDAWGRVEFHLEGDARMLGAWAYCDRELDGTRTWNATFVEGVHPMKTTQR